MFLITVQLSSSNGKTEFLSNTDLYLSRNVKHPTSNTDTLIHFLKANVGSGILAMPHAFKNSGLYFGLVGTLVIGFICTQSMLILLDCSYELCHRLQVPSMNFADVSYYAFRTGPYQLRKFSNFARLPTEQSSKNFIDKFKHFFLFLGTL